MGPLDFGRASWSEGSRTPPLRSTGVAGFTTSQAAGITAWSSRDEEDARPNSFVHRVVRLQGNPKLPWCRQAPTGPKNRTAGDPPPTSFSAEVAQFCSTSRWIKCLAC